MGIEVRPVTRPASIDEAGARRTRRPRIAFVAPRYHTNQHLAMQALMARGHDVRYYALFRGASEVYDALTPEVLGLGWPSRIMDRLLNRRRSLDFRAAYCLPPLFRFLSRLRRFRPDVLVVRNPNYLFSLLSLCAGRVLGARLVIYTQGPRHRLADGRTQLRYALMRLFRASWITPVEGDPRSGPPSPDVHLVPFVADVSVAPKDAGWLRNGELNILAIGKFIPRKNHVLLLEAMSRLRDLPLRLTLIGECSNAAHEAHLAEVVAATDRLGVSGRVTIRTNLPFREVQAAYAEHDLFVLASSREPAAVSVLEAMAHGIPVVCSDSNGTRFSVRHGHNGYVFRSDDSDDLVRGLTEMWERRMELAVLGSRARAVAEEEHGPERYYACLMAAATGTGSSAPTP